MQTGACSAKMNLQKQSDDNSQRSSNEAYNKNIVLDQPEQAIQSSSEFVDKIST